ncbi:unnamed protein product [Ixodes hexagonus]
MHCVLIDYFPKEEYSPDPNDSTMAIPSSVLLCLAFCCLIVSCLDLSYLRLFCLVQLFCLILLCPSFSFLTLFRLIFLDTGLMILVGMVIYISTFKAEVGSKLRPKSSFQEPLFTYSYGYSFLLAVTGLMSCELAGTFSIFLCIHRYQQQLKKKLERHKPVDHLPGCRRYNQPLSSSSSSSMRHHHHQHHHGGSGHQHHTSSSMSPSCSMSRSAGTSRRGGRGPGVGTGSEPGLVFEPSASPPPPPRHVLGRRGSPPPHLPMSESMRDLSYYNFPPFSRDTTCNTVSTTADNLTREYSREFSFETLRRTTPV